MAWTNILNSGLVLNEDYTFLGGVSTTPGITQPWVLTGSNSFILYQNSSHTINEASLYLQPLSGDIPYRTRVRILNYEETSGTFDVPAICGIESPAGSTEAINDADQPAPFFNPSIVLGPDGPTSLALFRVGGNNTTPSNVAAELIFEVDIEESSIVASPYTNTIADSSGPLNFTPTITGDWTFLELTSFPLTGSAGIISSGGAESLRYTPLDIGQDYTDTFSYRAIGDESESNIAIVTINVTHSGSSSGGSSGTPRRRRKNYVYELEKGWSFDGNFIPHFLELNWLWGDTPVDYTGVQKVRVHGLAKGNTKLSLAINSMEGDQLDYEQWYTEPQFIDFPRNPKFVDTEFMSVTNYTDTEARGVSVQMKFEGRNKDILSPEPSHVIQVLIVQSTPSGTGRRSN